MRITIENTTKIVTLEGMPCRVWEGETESGVKVHCFIPRIAARDGQDLRQFEAELQEQRKPSIEIEMIPARLIL